MSSNTLKIFFAGDFSPVRKYEDISLTQGKKIFGDLQKDIINADISFVNLETPLCHAKEKIKKTGPNLKARPECAKAIADAGFSIVGLANNHILDYGEKGLKETIGHCKNLGLITCGADNNLEEAKKPVVLERQGVKVGFIAVAEHEFSIAADNEAGAAPLDLINIIEQLEALRPDVDLLFITIHGGNEYFPYPRPGLRRICKFFIERGADGVVCHHAHIAGAYEIYKGKPIFYSLGNLIFDKGKAPKGWDEGYVVTLEYDIFTKSLSKYSLIPYVQKPEHGGVKKLSGEEKALFMEKIKSYNHILADDDAYAIKWSDFCDTSESKVLVNMFLPFKIRGLAKIIKYLGLSNIIPPRSNIPSRINLIRCESHRELLLEILNKRL